MERVDKSVSEILARLNLTPEKVARLVANKPVCPPGMRAYMAAIGRHGGRKSRRQLTTEQARAMVNARERKRIARVGLSRTGRHWKR